MLIRRLDTWIGIDRRVLPGEVHDLPDEIALLHIKSGAAEAVEAALVPAHSPVADAIEAAAERLAVADVVRTPAPDKVPDFFAPEPVATEPKHRRRRHHE